MRKLLAIGVLALSLALAQGQTNDPVVAEVGGKPVLKSYFDLQWGFFVRSTLNQQGLPYSPELEAQLSEAKPEFLTRVAQDVAVIDTAVARGFAPTKEQVDQIFEQQKGQFPDDEAFKQALEQAGIPSADAFRTLIYESLAYNNLVEDVLGKVSVSESAMRILYELSKEDYTLSATYCASHILVNTLEDYQKADAELKAGKAFAEVAATYSQDAGTKDQGGELGCEAEGTYVEPFEAALAKLKEGERTTEPVETEFGFHIILLAKVNPATTAPFEEVAESFKESITQNAVNIYLQSVAKQVGIKTYPDRLGIE